MESREPTCQYAQIHASLSGEKDVMTEWLEGQPVNVNQENWWGAELSLHREGSHAALFLE